MIQRFSPSNLLLKRIQILPHNVNVQDAGMKNRFQNQTAFCLANLMKPPG
jgi:hypothetical protein